MAVDAGQGEGVAKSENSTALSRAPVSLWEPNETLRLMAGARSARSEALLSIGVAGSSTVSRNAVRVSRYTYGYRTSPSIAIAPPRERMGKNQ